MRLPVAISPPTLTITVPVLPFAGAMATREPAAADSTVAESLLNLTVFAEAVTAKPTPFMTTLAPPVPLDGVIEMIGNLFLTGSGRFEQAT